MLGVLVDLLRFEAGHSLGMLTALAKVCEAWVRRLFAHTDTHAFQKSQSTLMLHKLESLKYEFKICNIVL